MNNNNRINRLCDNDLARVVERARRNNIHPVRWQVIDTSPPDGWVIGFVDDTTLWERMNVAEPGRFLFSPVFNPKEADFNGNPR